MIGPGPEPVGLAATARAQMFLFAVLLASTAAWIVVDPLGFYARVPGVAESGPLNVHLLRDAGFAYAALAFACLLALRTPAAAPAVTVASAVYLGLHAMHPRKSRHDSRSAMDCRFEG